MRSALCLDDAARPELAPSEGRPLTDRLQAYSRLLALAADELAALERGDLTKRRELSEARDELTREIQAPPAETDDEDSGVELDDVEPVTAPPLPDQLSSLLAEVLMALELRDEEERRMQDRWSSLEEDALKAIHVGGESFPSAPVATRIERHSTHGSMSVSDALSRESQVFVRVADIKTITGEVLT